MAFLQVAGSPSTNTRMHRQPQQRETNVLSSGASLSGSKGLRGSPSGVM